MLHKLQHSIVYYLKQYRRVSYNMVYCKGGGGLFFWFRALGLDGLEFLRLLGQGVGVFSGFRGLGRGLLCVRQGTQSAEELGNRA